MWVLALTSAAFIPCCFYEAKQCEFQNAAASVKALGAPHGLSQEVPRRVSRPLFVLERGPQACRFAAGPWPPCPIECAHSSAPTLRRALLRASGCVRGDVAMLFS